MRIEFSDACDGESIAYVARVLRGCTVMVHWRTPKPGQQHVFNHATTLGVVDQVDTDGIMLAHTDDHGEPLRVPSGKPVVTHFPWSLITKAVYQ